jgi:hypothetical protein
MTPEVEDLLRAAVDEKKSADSVFTREDGKPIKDFRGAWRNLCGRTGTGRLECGKCGAPLAGVKCECGGVRKCVDPHDLSTLSGQGGTPRRGTGVGHYGDGRMEWPGMAERLDDNP